MTALRHHNNRHFWKIYLLFICSFLRKLTRNPTKNQHENGKKPERLAKRREQIRRRRLLQEIEIIIQKPEKPLITKSRGKDCWKS